MIALVAVVVLAVMFGSTLSQPLPSTLVIEGNPLLNRPAPDLTLQTTDGQTVSLADLRGKPVIVNFWASWCVPCREEFPLLVAAYQRYHDQGLEILGVIHDDGPQTATDFATGYGATWPLLADPGDQAWQDFKGALVPISFYIDRDGIIRAISYGPPPSGYLDDQIAKII